MPTRTALSKLRKGLLEGVPDLRTIYTDPSGTGGYHPPFSTVIEANPKDYSVAHFPMLDTPQAGGKFDVDAVSAFDIMCDGQLLWRFASRMDVAMRSRDERLFMDGKPIIREYFGQKQRGGDKRQGFSLTKNRVVKAGDNHDTHFHGSIHRLFANNTPALQQVLSVLMGEALNTTPDNKQVFDISIFVQHFKAGADGKATWHIAAVQEWLDTIGLPVPKKNGKVTGDREGKTRDSCLKFAADNNLPWHIDRAHEIMAVMIEMRNQAALGRTGKKPGWFGEIQY